MLFLTVTVVLTVLLYVGGPLLARLHAVPPIAGFAVFVLSSLPGVLALFAGGVVLMQGDRWRGATGLVIGLVPIATLALGLVKARHIPPINDISTNLDNPPQLTVAAQAPENRGKDLAYPEAFKAQVAEGYDGLISLQLQLPADAAFRLARDVAAKRPDWTLTRIDPATLTLEGEETSGIFQFTDDFVIRILPLDGSAQVDMRSRSRVGKGDFGANARRIRDYFAALSAAAAGTVASR